MISYGVCLSGSGRIFDGAICLVTQAPESVQNILKKKKYFHLLFKKFTWGLWLWCLSLRALENRPEAKLMGWSWTGKLWPGLYNLWMKKPDNSVISSRVIKLWARCISLLAVLYDPWAKNGFSIFNGWKKMKKEFFDMCILTWNPNVSTHE